MARELDGMAPVGGADALAAPVGGADALAAAGGYADTLRAEGRADALALTTVADALAAPAAAWTAAGADPLTGYPDATLLLGAAAPPRPASAPSRPASAPRSASARPYPGAPPAGEAYPGPTPGDDQPGGGPGRTPGSPPPWAARGGTGGTAGMTTPPMPPPRPDAISWADLTIRGRASAARRPAPRPPAPPAGGTGWDSFLSGVHQPGGRTPWSGRPAANSPQSLRELLDLIRRSMRS